MKRDNLRNESKKVIAFFHNRMDIGGVERALLRLTDEFDKGKYDVRVVLMSEGGVLQEEFCNDVQISCISSISIKSLIKSMNILGLIKAIYYRIRIRSARNLVEEGYWTSKTYTVPNEYINDYAVGYSHSNLLLSAFVANCEAKKKVLWFHTRIKETIDFSTYEKLILSKYDVIICVSNSVKEYLLGVFPNYREKVITVYNCIDSNTIIRLSQEPIYEPMQHFSLVTVGRLAEVKGQHQIPVVLRKLLDSGHDVYWYLVGDGPLRQQIESDIKKYDLHNRLILVGSKTNPYPYIKECDIYVQTSLSEGYCTTTVEAKILNKCVVTTDVPGMREQFRDGENGFIVDISENALYERLEDLLSNDYKRVNIIKTVTQEIVSNEREMLKLYEALEKE